MKESKELIDRIIKEALKEDIGKGDITTSSLFDKNFKIKAFLFAKQDGVLCGLEVFRRVFEVLSPSFVFKFHFKDGDKIRKGSIIGEITGPVKELLKGERTALNFLQRMSGIATETRKLVEKSKGKVKIYDTRKTTPNLRILEKYAVKTGGGENHRMGLYDMVLIKDTHIAALMEKEGIDKIEAISLSIKRARKHCKGKVKIEIEVNNYKQALVAYREGADIIMFDNADERDVFKFKRFLKEKKKVEIEWSGNVSLRKVERISKLPVDRVSAGYITHSAKAIDFSLKILPGQTGGGRTAR